MLTNFLEMLTNIAKKRKFVSTKKFLRDFSKFFKKIQFFVSIFRNICEHFRNICEHEKIFVSTSKYLWAYQNVNLANFNSTSSQYASGRPYLYPNPSFRLHLDHFNQPSYAQGSHYPPSLGWGISRACWQISTSSQYASGLLIPQRKLGG